MGFTYDHSANFGNKKKASSPKKSLTQVMRETLAEPTKASHWKQTKYNEYTLIVGSSVLKFETYEKLYRYCVAKKLNPTQV